MLRASEYLPPPDPTQASRRVIRGCDLTFYQEGVTTTLSQASSVSVQLRESKTDQFQRGQIRTHHCTGEEICPIKALQAHGRENPGWLNDPGAVVFQYQGVGITRERVSELLRLAAVAEGFPAHLMGSHSLRKGGVTAMLSCTDDIEQVKRFGGWKSDAVHAYLYSDHAACPDRAKAMLRSTPVLHPPQRPQSQPPASSRPIGHRLLPLIRSPLLGGIEVVLGAAPRSSEALEAFMRLCHPRWKRRTARRASTQGPGQAGGGASGG